MAANPVHIDPDAGIPDLIRRLGDDAKQLLGNEARLAKIETRENLHKATRGGLWLGIAFGIGVVALVALTITLTAIIGRIANGNYWVGALVTGVVEVVVALVLIKRGVAVLGSTSYTLPETREGAAAIVGK